MTEEQPDDKRKLLPPGYLKEGFTRYVIFITYKGTHYHGFQLQPSDDTVQGRVEAALSRLLQKKIEIYSAGRTDAGVHGVDMPAQFDFEEALPAKFMHAINGMLPMDISVNSVCIAARPDFNVRFAAISRSYVYRIARKKLPFESEFAWMYLKSLDLENMKRGAEIFLQHNSFESFCKKGGSNKTFFCKMMESRFEEKGDILEYHVKADRFLRGMVRALMGTLLEMGKGSLDTEGLIRILEAKDRCAAGGSLPPQGLILKSVGYREGEFLPWNAQEVSSIQG